MKRFILLFLVMVSAVAFADEIEIEIVSDDPGVQFDANGWQDYEPAPDWPLTLAGSISLTSGIYLMARHWWIPVVARKKIDFSVTTEELAADPVMFMNVKLALEYDETKATAGAIMTGIGILALVFNFAILPNLE